VSSTRTIAVILVVLGIVVLAYSGIAFSTPGQPINMGPIHVETTHSHFIPPVVRWKWCNGVLSWFDVIAN